MKTLIIYGSKYGFTETCARKLGEQIDGEVEIFSVSKSNKIDFNEYNHIVIGSSIYIGNFFKPMKVFLIKRKKELLRTNYRIFLTGLGGLEETISKIDDIIDSDLKKGSKDNAYFGGDLFLDKMNFLDRSIMKKISKTAKFKTGIEEEEIIKFANKINEEENV